MLVMAMLHKQKMSQAKRLKRCLWMEPVIVEGIIAMVREIQFHEWSAVMSYVNAEFGALYRPHILLSLGFHNVFKAPLRAIIASQSQRSPRRCRAPCCGAVVRPYRHHHFAGMGRFRE